MLPNAPPKPARVTGPAVEQLAALRAIPNLAVLRPADANEVRECWKAALQWDGPAALALTLDCATAGFALSAIAPIPAFFFDFFNFKIHSTRI